MNYHTFDQYRRLRYIREYQQRIIEKVDEYLKDLDREMEAYEKGGR